MALVAPALAVVSPQSLVIVLVVAGLWAAAQSWTLGEPALDVRILLGTAALVMVAATSALWSADAKMAVKTAARVGALAVAGACLLRNGAALDDRERRRLALGMTAGLMIAAVLLLLEYVGPHIISHLHQAELDTADIDGKSIANRSTSLVVLLLVPTVFALARRVSLRAGIGLAVLMVAVLAVGDNSTSKLAIVVASAVFAVTLALRSGPFLLALARVLVVLAVVLPPVFALQIGDPQGSYADWGWKHYSLHHRLTIWQFVGQRIAERPLAGWGMDAARSLPGGEEMVVVVRPGMSDRRAEQVLPLHPHNAVLQVWLELGVLGAAAFAAILWWLVGRACRLGHPGERATALAMVAAALVIACSSYGLWQSWWQAALWICATSAAGCLRPSRE
jgi:O-antigen ligase